MVNLVELARIMSMQVNRLIVLEAMDMMLEVIKVLFLHVYTLCILTRTCFSFSLILPVHLIVMTNFQTKYFQCNLFCVEPIRSENYQHCVNKSELSNQ